VTVADPALASTYAVACALAWDDLVAVGWRAPEP
jgi:hypothetical protein